MNVLIISALLGVTMMFAGLFIKKSAGIQWVALLGIVGLMIAAILEFHHTEAPVHHFNMLMQDQGTAWFNMLITFCTLIYFFLFHKQMAQVGRNDAEYFALIFFILCGASLLSGYTNLLSLFLGIEILSIPQYILAGSDKESFKSNEASLKYFLMGSFSTGLLLMGITLLYGATGSFELGAEAFTSKFTSDHMGSMGMLGIFLMIVSFGFKVSAAPMHFWTPDVYDGTPTAFTPFMATVVKVVVFYAFIRLFGYSFHAVNEQWQLIVAVMIALTLFIGNITAVYQFSVKRMMAYSSIAQAGFMLFGVFAFNDLSHKGIILYSLAYTLASFGVFAVIIRLKDYTFDGFNGLAKQHPVLAFTATICLLSLAGIPLTGGFFAKYFMLSAVVEQGKWMALVVFAVLMAAVSAYYYFKVISSMYFKTGDATLIQKPSQPELALLVINALIVVLLGILPHIVF
jgi:NADH-quinone oxidoreductase subunit N